LVFARDRPEAASAVAQMKEMGLRVIVLTGDVETTARSVGDQLGIDEVDAQLHPEPKVERIKLSFIRTGKSQWSETE